MPNPLAQLRQFIAAHYALEELRVLCLDLGVPYDDLDGEGLSLRAGELVAWLERRGELDCLLSALRQDRPGPFAAAGLDPAPPGSEEISPAASPERGRGANPFYAGGRLNDPGQFFGRTRLLREIRAELNKRCSVSLVGPSEIGKSSLLYYLYLTRADWLADPDATLAYVDLQGVLDEADFCETVLTRLGEAGDCLRALKKALAGREVILLFDEVERLAEPDFNPRLHDLLRSLSQEPHFAMCLATQRPLDQVFPARTPGGVSPFHNVFSPKSLGPFSPAEAGDFLRARLAGSGVTFSPAEVERLLADSGCRPACLQRLAQALFAAKQEHKGRE